MPPCSEEDKPGFVGRAFPVHADPVRPPLAQGLSFSPTISATHLTLRAAPAQSPFTDSSGKEGRLTTTPSKKKKALALSKE